MEKKRQSGFTLIEVIIAAMILVVACIPLMGGFLTANKVNVKGRQTEQAMTVAQNLVEGVKAVGANNAYLWSISSTSFTVVPTGSYSEKSGKQYIENKEIDFSNYETVNGTKFSAVEGLVTTKTVALNSYVIKLNGIVFGSTEYDAYIFIEQDSSDLENMAAYAYKKEFDTAGIKVMDYYKITAYVGVDFNSLVASDFPGGDVAHSQTIEDFKTLLLANCKAKYIGTVVTQT